MYVHKVQIFKLARPGDAGHDWRPLSGAAIHFLPVRRVVAGDPDRAGGVESAAIHDALRRTRLPCDTPMTEAYIPGGQVASHRHSRNSLFTGILLIFFGALLLSRRFFPGLAIGSFLARYWPVLLIFWGLTLLLEQRAARKAGRPFRALSGSDFVIVVALVLLISGAIVWNHFSSHAADWGISPDWMRESATSSEELPGTAVQAGDQIQVNIPAGDITVHNSEDNMLHVVAKRMGYAWDKNDAQRMAQRIDVAIVRQSGGYSVQPAGGFPSPDARVDLDIQVPAEAKLAAQTGQGDVSISDMKGGATVITRTGDIEIHNVAGDVDIQSRHGDAEISGVQGNLTLEGAGGQVEIADVTGSVTLQGEYFGPIRARNVTGEMRFTSSHTQATISQLTGHMEVDSDSLEVADVGGALKLSTHDKDVTLENIAGAIDVSDRHGDLDVRLSKPLSAPIHLVNDTGDVTLTLPSQPNFTIDASSRSGKIESDFDGPGLTLENGEDSGHLQGSYGKGGPPIHIETSYGTLSLHQAP